MSKPSNKALFSQRVGVDTSDDIVKPKLEEAAAAMAATRKAEEQAAHKPTAAAAAAAINPASTAARAPVCDFSTPPTGFVGDFRGWLEPARTLERIRAVMYDPRLSHGARCAAASLALAFSDRPDRQLVSVKKLLPDDKGYSAKLRNKALTALSEAGLIRFEVVPGRGCYIELLF